MPLVNRGNAFGLTGPPLREQHSISSGRVVGGRPPHTLLRRLAISAPYTWMLTPFSPWLSRWRQPRMQLSPRKNRSTDPQERNAKATSSAATARRLGPQPGRSGVPAGRVGSLSHTTARHGRGTTRVGGSVPQRRNRPSR
jgi:hypothetical protein